MPGATPIHGFPTMLDTDPLSDVAEAIRNLANNLDGVDWTNMALGAGWTGFCRYAYASGIVSVQYALTKASWAANENAASGLPALYRPTNGPLYNAGINLATGAALMMFLATTGECGPSLASATATGVRGVFTYVAS